MSRSRIAAAAVLAPLLAALVCSSADAAPGAGALTAEFAAMNTGGWTGADASWSVRLPDGRIVWLFGDTFIGGVDHDGCRDRATPVVHNSAVVQSSDGSYTTLVGHGPEGPEALVPGERPGRWYWPGPPVVGDDTLQVPMARIERTGPGDWDVKAIGTALAIFDLKQLRLRSLVRLKVPHHVNMASAAVTAGRFTYVYGTHDYADGHKDAYVARAAAGSLSPPWEFWDGRAWSPRAADAQPVASGVSNQFSVLETARGWRLVTQVPMQREVIAFAGTSPIGPWTTPRLVTELPEIPDAFTYNAIVHPEFSRDGSWVLGFNVNGRDMDAVFANADLYRPRFLQIQIP